MSVSHFDELKEVFMSDIRAEVLMNDIPDTLILNWDQTLLYLVPTGQWAMDREKKRSYQSNKLEPWLQ